MKIPPIRVEVDGDGLVDYLSTTSEVTDTGETWIVTADVRDILDGVLQNLLVVIDAEGDDDSNR